MSTCQARIVTLEGDGIGAEIMSATLAVLKVAAERFALDLQFEAHTIGFASLETEGTTFPGPVLAAARAADGTILGPVSHNDYPPVAEGGLNPSGQLRKQLDLFANIRPARTLPGLEPAMGRPVDLVVVRENTEGFYADRNMYAGSGEFMPSPDVALAVRNITRSACMRIAETAFALARERRGKVTSVHKANVLRLSDGLYLDCTREVASRYPDIAYEEKLIDAMAALLVRDASAFDVIVTTNMYGDILSDEASELSGSLGLAASLNAGDTAAVAQAQHGSAPDIAGKDIANPASLIGSAAMLLDWLARHGKSRAFMDAGRGVQAALEATIADPARRTRDLGGPLGTRAFTDAVIAELRKT